MTANTTILHISDIHIESTPENTFDHTVVLDPLLKRVEEDYTNGLQPEIIVITGDIAYKGIKAEYAEAQKFLNNLLGKLNIPPERMFIVPGNHDVNRKIYRPKDIPSYGTMEELNNDLINHAYRQDLFKGMNEYFDFIQTHYPHLQAIENNLIPFVRDFTTNSGKRLALIGLNSAWMCRTSSDAGRIAIGEYQMKLAAEELKKLGTTDLILNLFHHPVDYLWREDKTICRSYIDGEHSILLTGHLHEPQGWMIEDLTSRLIQFQAGGAYLGTESKWPSRYQYITLGWDKNIIRLDFRAFDKENRIWHVDAKIGKDGSKELELFKVTKPHGVSMPPQITNEPIFPDEYRQWIIQNYQHLDSDKLCGSEMIPLSLPEIFVPLYTQVYKYKKDYRWDELNDSKKHKPADLKKLITDRDALVIEEHKIVDLEELITMRKALLIGGHPGSGKTTLTKYIAYCLAQDSKNCGPMKRLQGYLPLVIFMKDLNEFFNEVAVKKAACRNAFDIIGWYCATKFAETIEPTVIEGFMLKGRAIILLDGFDELMPEHRDTIANYFADLRIKYSDIRVVLTSRPHGITGAVFTRFWEDQVKINPMTIKQVEEFVRKWFTYFYSGKYGPALQNAESLIGDIKSHPAIDNMIDNPLMLTAICILYHDQKELPGQRAELYKRFVDNMIYRRFGAEYENVLNFLKTLAFAMHTSKTKVIDEKGALMVLKDILKQAENEASPEYNTRLKNKFYDVEARCGLLKLGDGQYQFWHLTFQEFLCAEYICDNEAEPISAIDQYWDDDWYTEMIKLYIGYISIRNKATANRIVENALKNNSKKEILFKAASALNDIHRDRRDTATLNLAQNKLQSIFETERIASRATLAEAGEYLGWLGDPRDLKALIPIEEGEYKYEVKRRVSIEAFKIGKYPVTNRWYAEFINAGGYQNKDYWIDEGGRQWLVKAKVESPKYWHERKWRCPNAPVVGVCWWEAKAFCQWLCKSRADRYVYRLPTELEWRIAAAGKEQRRYAWGNENDYTRCNCCHGADKIDKTSPVGIFELGKTPNGIYDLWGNVWEWCSTLDGLSCLGCGGSWDFKGEGGIKWLFLNGNARPSDRTSNLGFRIIAVAIETPEDK